MPRTSRFMKVRINLQFLFSLSSVGSKFYWRSRLNVDISIMHHTHEQVIFYFSLSRTEVTKINQVLEVIPYDTDLGCELPRLFLSSAPLLSAIEEDVKTKLVAAYKPGAKPIDMDTKREVTITCLATHILSR